MQWPTGRFSFSWHCPFILPHCRRRYFATMAGVGCSPPGCGSGTHRLLQPPKKPAWGPHPGTCTSTRPGTGDELAEPPQHPAAEKMRCRLDIKVFIQTRFRCTLDMKHSSVFSQKRGSPSLNNKDRSTKTETQNQHSLTTAGQSYQYVHLQPRVLMHSLKFT